VLRIGVDRIGVGSLPAPAAYPAARPAASLFEWRVTVGHALARRVRGGPHSPISHLHPKP